VNGELEEFHFTYVAKPDVLIGVSLHE